MTIDCERQKPLFCPKTLTRQALELQVFRPESLRITFTLLGVTTPSDLIKNKQHTPFNIGRAIELNGFKLEEATPLIEGLSGKVNNPREILRNVLDWTGGQPFLTQKLCKLILEDEVGLSVEQLVQSRIIEDWEYQDEPQHLRTIRDRILIDEQRIGRRLGLYKQILQHGEISADYTQEQTELRLSGLVVKYGGKLRVYNPIYQTVFNLVWVEEELDKTRPYAEKIKKWVESNFQDKLQLLRGEDLEKARNWSSDKSLSNLDQNYLTQSNKLYNNELKQQQRQIIEIGILASIVSAILIIGTGFYAAQKVKEAVEAQQQAIEAQKGTQLEQAGVNSLFQFKSGELSSLVSAMQSTQDLQKLIGNRNNPKDYPAVSPVLALQKILDDIHEQNYFEAGQGDVKGAVFLPDGKNFITAGEGKENKELTLQIWNLAGKKEASLQGHEGGLLSGVNAVSVGGNAQNPVIASAGEDGTVLLWNKSGQQIKQLVAEGKPNYDSFTAITVTPDGQKIIAGKGNGTVYLWDQSGKQLKTWVAHGKKVTAISFSKNGQTLATSGNDGLARIWTVTGNKLGELKHPQIKRMLGVSLSPDGKFVATAFDDNQAIIWTVNGQEIRRLEGHQGWVTVVNFSPNGQSVATGSDDGSVKLWNAKTGENLQNFRGHRGAILSASFSLDGKQLVSTGKDGFVRLWNLADRPLQGLELTGFKDDVNAIAFSPDGKTIAGAGNEGVMRQWDATSGKELKVWKEAIQRAPDSQNNVQDIAFSPDGKFIVAGGLRIGIARVWDLAGSLTEPKVRLKGNEDKQEAHQGDIVSVAFSPNRQLIATTGSYDKTMRIWNPKSMNGELVAKTEPQEKEMSRVLFIPGENQIVTGDGNGNVAIWDLAAKQISKWKVHPTQIRGLGITPDRSQIVTADKTGTVKILDRSGNKQKEFFSYQSGINELVISPDGKLIATGGMDGTVRLWDFQDRQVAEFRNPKGAIWAIAFSPDSKRIALAGNNGFVGVRSLDSLPKLMEKGCTWLQDYLALHPSEKNSLCP